MSKEFHRDEMTLDEIIEYFETTADNGTGAWNTNRMLVANSLRELMSMKKCVVENDFPSFRLSREELLPDVLYAALPKDHDK